MLNNRTDLFVFLWDKSLYFFSPPPFRNFFQAACIVPEPEEKFNIDEYSDMVTLSKPVIYISIEEIINTHSVSAQSLVSLKSGVFFNASILDPFHYSFHLATRQRLY